MSSLSFSAAIGGRDRSSGVGFNPIGSISSSSSSSSSSFSSSLYKNGGAVGGNGQRNKKTCLVVRCEQQQQPPPPPPRGPMQTWKLVLGKLKMRKRKHVDRWWRNIDPNIKSGYLELLCPWKPLPYKRKPIILPFEKPLRSVEKKVVEMREISKELGPEYEKVAINLEQKYRLALKTMYSFLTPIQRVQIARHPHRPTFYDHILNITDKWLELHGDRAGYDDPAIVTGLGSINGKTYMFIGHQKGRNTRENIQRNFGMPTPHGYRKALRLMRYAEHHGFPIVTMIDTPGAFADLKSEELGQGEAIAFNLRSMFSLKVPVVSIVIGEGGSGGALAIGVGNRLYMLENSIFYVASPEACAAILYKSSSAAPKAAAKLRITASELCKLNIADGVIKEPLGGAHYDPLLASQKIKAAIVKSVEALETMDPDSLIEQRRAKYRHIGGFEMRDNINPIATRNMKKREVAVSRFDKRLEVDLEELRKAHASKTEAAGPAVSKAKEIRRGRVGTQRRRRNVRQGEEGSGRKEGDKQ